MSLADDLRRAADAGKPVSRGLLLHTASELDRLSGRSADLARVTAERDALASLEAERISRDEFEDGLRRALQAEQDRFRRNMERFGAQEDEQQRLRDRDAAS